MCELFILIVADEGSIKFNLIDRKSQIHNRFVMGNDGIHLKGLNVMVIKDPKTKLPIFTTASKLIYHLEKQTKNLESPLIHAKEIVSPIGSKLEIQSLNTYVRGVEGTKIDGKEILISAGQNIHLKSSNASIVLDAENGIYLDFEKIPKFMNQGSNDLQYKICVCFPKAILYRVAISKLQDLNDPCKHFDKSIFNPCI